LTRSGNPIESPTTCSTLIVVERRDRLSATSDSSLQMCSCRLGARCVMGGIATMGNRHENFGAFDTYQHHPCRVRSCPGGGTAWGVCRCAGPRLRGPAVLVRIRRLLRRTWVSALALTLSAPPPLASPESSITAISTSNLSASSPACSSLNDSVSGSSDDFFSEISPSARQRQEPLRIRERSGALRLS
jgi:hypothetical protein